MNGCASGEVGNALVFTSDNGGHSPEQMAEMALNKIMVVSETAPPAIRDQALAYKDHIRKVLVFYMAKMAENERDKRGYSFLDLALSWRWQYHFSRHV